MMCLIVVIVADYAIFIDHYIVMLSSGFKKATLKLNKRGCHAKYATNTNAPIGTVMELAN